MVVDDTVDHLKGRKTAGAAEQVLRCLVIAIACLRGWPLPNARRLSDIMHGIAHVHMHMHMHMHIRARGKDHDS